MTTAAFCWRSGEIGFCEGGLDDVPAGTIGIACGEETALRDRVSARARHAWNGDLLVPGIPEASDGDEALSALEAWVRWAFPDFNDDGERTVK